MGQWIGRVNSLCVLNDTSLSNFCISFDSKKQMLISGKVIKLYSWRIIWKERRCLCLACQKVFLQLFSESDLRKYCTTNWNKMCCFSSARTEFSPTFLFRLQTRKPLLRAMPSGAIFLPASQGCAWDPAGLPDCGEQGLAGRWILRSLLELIFRWRSSFTALLLVCCCKVHVPPFSLKRKSVVSGGPACAVLAPALMDFL